MDFATTMGGVKGTRLFSVRSNLLAVSGMLREEFPRNTCAVASAGMTFVLRGSGGQSIITVL